MTKPRTGCAVCGLVEMGISAAGAAIAALCWHDYRITDSVIRHLCPEHAKLRAEALKRVTAKPRSN